MPDAYAEKVAEEIETRLHGYEGRQSEQERQVSVDYIECQIIFSKGGARTVCTGKRGI